MNNFREMHRNGSRMAVRKKFKLLKYEHIIVGVSLFPQKLSEGGGGKGFTPRTTSISCSAKVCNLFIRRLLSLTEYENSISVGSYLLNTISVTYQTSK